MRILIKNKRQLAAGSKRLLEYTGDNKILAFYGSMGAGKTTIIKAVCRILGAVDIVSSPTFTLINEYKTSRGEQLFHIDFYRIKKKDEVFDFGIEEYLSCGSYCFIEWPELVEDILPPETVKIKITVGENQERILDIP
ncbi:MAG: tRNA (adenosine(37)-N6)-threonylcarbamoyltransferase complex ATPase subunit type 1 TsaE [Bacteroidales bacterium]